MSPTEPICAGDVWQFHHTHNTDKETNRWCVVITGDQGDGYVRVVYGGKKGHPGRQHVAVTDPQDLKAMGLTLETFFRYGSVLDVKVSAFRRKMGQCPSDLFVDIESIEYHFGKRYRKPVPQQD